jgi:hypothetical protein
MVGIHTHHTVFIFLMPRWIEHCGGSELSEPPRLKNRIKQPQQHQACNRRADLDHREMQDDGRRFADRCGDDEPDHDQAEGEQHDTDRDAVADLV